MRIIAGSKARMPLLGPRDLTTRPITDRVKESLFNIIRSLLGEAQVADLFCGTGSLGLEALSRGACHAIMVDSDRDALQRLRKNIDKLELTEQVQVVSADIFKVGIPAVAGAGEAEGSLCEKRCTLVFVDPPYMFSRQSSAESRLGRLLAKIGTQTEDRAVVIVRHAKQTELLRQYGTLFQYERREYGSMAITFLENNVG